MLANYAKFALRISIFPEIFTSYSVQIKGGYLAIEEVLSTIFAGCRVAIASSHLFMTFVISFLICLFFASTYFPVCSSMAAADCPTNLFSRNRDVSFKNEFFLIFLTSHRAESVASSASWRVRATVSAYWRLRFSKCSSAALFSG